MSGCGLLSPTRGERTSGRKAHFIFGGALLLLVGGLVFLNRLTWLTGKLSSLNSLALWLERVLTGGR